MDVFKKMDEFLKTHFPVSTPVVGDMSEINISAQPINGAAITDRKNHTIPLKLDLVDDLYMKRSIESNDVDLGAVYDFAKALIDYFWFSRFMDDEDVKIAIDTLLEKENLSPAVLAEEGLMSRTTVDRYSRQSKITFQSIYPDQD